MIAYINRALFAENIPIVSIFPGHTISCHGHILEYCVRKSQLFKVRPTPCENMDTICMSIVAVHYGCFCGILGPIRDTIGGTFRF